MADDGASPKFKPLRASVDDFDCHASTDAMAETFDIALETVRQLEKDGLFVKVSRGRFDFLPSLRNYFRRQREVAAGRGGGDEQANQAKENALLSRAKRENLELKNAALRGDTVAAADVAAQWADDWMKVRNAMMTVPSRLATQMPHLTRADINVIDRAIRKALQSAAEDVGGASVDTADDPQAGAGETYSAAGNQPVEVD